MSNFDIEAFEKRLRDNPIKPEDIEETEGTRIVRENEWRMNKMTDEERKEAGARALRFLDGVSRKPKNLQV